MTLEWKISPNSTGYEDAAAAMEARVAAIDAGNAPELVWLLQHPPLYTAGTSADPVDLKLPGRFPVYQTGRGGKYTYHGPGQRVGYVLLDLRRRGQDLRAHIWRLEEWVIRALADWGVKGERRCGRVGIWVVRPDGREEKIAAVGVRVRRWITFHGMAINVHPDLEHFGGIVPCGLADYGVTSLHALGHKVSMAQIDDALRRHWNDVFEREKDAANSCRVTASG